MHPESPAARREGIEPSPRGLEPRWTPCPTPRDASRDERSSACPLISRAVRNADCVGATLLLASPPPWNRTMYFRFIRPACIPVHLRWRCSKQERGWTVAMLRSVVVSSPLTYPQLGVRKETAPFVVVATQRLFAADPLGGIEPPRVGSKPTALSSELKRGMTPAGVEPAPSRLKVWRPNH